MIRKCLKSKNTPEKHKIVKQTSTCCISSKIRGFQEKNSKCFLHVEQWISQKGDTADLLFSELAIVVPDRRAPLGSVIVEEDEFKHEIHHVSQVLGYVSLRVVLRPGCDIHRHQDHYRNRKSSNDPVPYLLKGSICQRYDLQKQIVITHQTKHKAPPTWRKITSTAEVAKTNSETPRACIESSRCVVSHIQPKKASSAAAIPHQTQIGFSFRYRARNDSEASVRTARKKLRKVA